MKIAIMQPYFFPYLGYFALIKYSDQFIVFDTPQFIRHGWIERNRILKPNDGWQYIKVPLVKNSQNINIKDSRIRNTENWKERIFAQLDHYKKKAKFYKETTQLIEEAFSIETDSIVELNVNALRVVCKFLNIDLNCSIYSKLNLEIEKPELPDEWALNISKVLNAKEYINPIGGMSFFDRSKYEANHLKLSFIEYSAIYYNQFRPSFEPNLSIIDALMFNSAESIHLMLNSYKLI